MIKRCDLKKSRRGVVVHDRFMNRWIPLLLFYDGTDAYTIGQGNDHYIYYNAATVAIPNGCPTSTAPKNASPTRKGLGVVRTDWWVYTRTCRPCVKQ